MLLAAAYSSLPKSHLALWNACMCSVSMVCKEPLVDGDKQSAFFFIFERHKVFIVSSCETNVFNPQCLFYLKANISSLSIYLCSYLFIFLFTKRPVVLRCPWHLSLYELTEKKRGQNMHRVAVKTLDWLQTESEGLWILFSMEHLKVAWT